MVLLGAILTLLVAIPAAATVVQQGNLRVTVLSQVLPFKLPRTEKAPIAVFVSGHIDSVDGETPPQLQRMTIKLNRHGLLQSRGLPTCPIPEVRASSTQQALARCAPALIGSGQFWAHIVLPQQPPYPTRGRLLIFNGNERVCPTSAGSSARRGRLPAGPRRTRERASMTSGHVSASEREQSTRAECHMQKLLIASIYATNPFSTSFVIPFRITHIAKGPYGTLLTASFSQALRNWGIVDRIKLTLRRKYHFGGRRLSYFNSSCPAPSGAVAANFPLALANFYFAEGQHIQAGVSKSCRVKR